MAPKRRAGGSISGKSSNIETTMIAMVNQMYLDYFTDLPIWGSNFFQLWYCMKKNLFNTILEKVCVAIRAEAIT